MKFQNKNEQIKKIKRELRHKNKLIKDLQRAIGIGNDYTAHIEREVVNALDKELLTKVLADKILEYKNL